MPSMLITGAGRGLGLEFARQYAAEGWRVHATCRDPENAAELQKLKGKVVIHRLDVRAVPQIAALKSALGGEPLEILINNAGIFGPRGQTIAQIEDEVWLDVLHTNAVAPLRIADALADNVAKSEKKLMVFLASTMGSIARSAAGFQPYRMSKAALNAGVRSLSLELESRGVICVLLSPGWVRTDMGGRGANIDPKTSIEGMRALIARLTASDNGRFLGFDGRDIPW